MLAVPTEQDPIADTKQTGRRPRDNAATGISAAGVRALSAQMLAFYFRAPIKAFFRTRVDYMAFARAVNPRVANGRWSLQTTTPALIAHAVRIYGWRFIPNQLLPPLIANAGIGAVLYTSYLQTISALHEPTSRGIRRTYPPASPVDTVTAGFVAGTIQSVVAAPLDAIQVRLRADEMLGGRHRSIWQYGYHKLKEIGLRGIFAGWSLSFARDAFGYAVFFSAFEYIKSQSYYSFVTSYYGSLDAQYMESAPSVQFKARGVPLIQPHYALEPCFLMLAGLVASVAQQGIQYPLNIIENLYISRLEHLDRQVRLSSSRRELLRLYYSAYQETWRICEQTAARVGGWRLWLYRGFARSAITQVPSTSAALVIFELVRRKYATLADAVYIHKDGYDILLT